MNAPNILTLLYCVGILGVLLCGVQSDVLPTNDLDNTLYPQNSQVYKTTALQETSPSSLTSAASSESEHRKFMSSVSTVSQSLPKHSVPPSPGPNPTTTTTTTTTNNNNNISNKLANVFNRKECFQVLMVAGGLIIACTILLLSTLFLTCKVCQMSRRIKMLSSNSEYWMGTATKDKSKSETETKETSMLMADVSQTQEEVGTSATKEEEEEKGTEDGQIGEENKKESGDTANSEEASADENKKETPVIGDENSSSPKLQEEAAGS